MHVIFLAPHFPANQPRFVAGLKKVGARVTAIGDVPVEYLPSSVASMLDGYEAVRSLADIDAVTEAVRRIQKRGPWVHRLEATVETHVLIAAEVRERTGIPGTSLQTTNFCRDKFEMKRFLAARGVPCAAHAAIDSRDDALAFIQEVGFPVILKPRLGAGAAGTYRIDDVEQLDRILKEEGVGTRKDVWAMEAFISGHEGFYDTLVVGGRVVFEAVNHYYPNVLEGMRTSWISPQIITTNRIHADGYTKLRKFGRQVISDLGLGTTATHMEWFAGPKGLAFSEIGARPPGVCFWDMYCAANDFDLYEEWARAVCWESYEGRPSHNYSAGIVSLRPNRSGTIRGTVGLDEVQRRYGPYILDAHIPAPGSKTAPVGSGYMGHAWMRVRHPDYDACRAMMDDIGRTFQLIAE
jgi:formate-dependent phosphoribosylglycinamide formyltransferase (GAR transformylase)